MIYFPKTYGTCNGANKAISLLKKFLFETINLKSSFAEIGINDSHFEEMAVKACGKAGVIKGFQTLNPHSVVEIYKACLYEQKFLMKVDNLLEKVISFCSQNDSEIFNLIKDCVQFWSIFG